MIRQFLRTKQWAKARMPRMSERDDCFENGALEGPRTYVGICLNNKLAGCDTTTFFL